MTCEFCHTASRKDYLAQHVRSKCAKGVAQLLLKEWVNGDRVTPLKQYLEARPIQNIPIHSDMYEDATYWFGVEPRLFDTEDGSWKFYTDNEDNRKAHEAFLRECIGLISLLDLIDCERELHIKSPEYTELHRKYMTLRRETEEELKEVTAEREARDRRIHTLMEELRDAKNSMDSPETMDELRMKLTHLETQKVSLSQQLENANYSLRTIESDHSKQVTEIYEAHRVRRTENEELYERLFSQYQALKKENERLQVSVKKEAQKMMDKQEKERHKDKEKARKAKEKLKEEIALAKMKARRGTPKKKKKHVSSSSESSSDSDSSSSSDSD